MALYLAGYGYVHMWMGSLRPTEKARSILQEYDAFTVSELAGIQRQSILWKLSVLGWRSRLATITLLLPFSFSIALTYLRSSQAFGWVPTLAPSRYCPRLPTQ